MGKLKSETLEVIVDVNGSKAHKEINDLNTAISDQVTLLKKMRADLKAVGKEHGRNSAEYKAQQKAIDKLSRSIDNNKKKLDDAYKSLKVTDMTLGELRSRISRLQSSLKNIVPGTEKWKELNEELAIAKKRLEVLNNSSRTSNWFQRISRSASGAVAIAQTAWKAAQKAFNVIKGSIQTIADFEQANANLASILGKNVKEINLLTDSALSLGRTTEYTASQVTGLQTELAKLGFNEGAIMNMQEPILHFATAVGTDLSSAASLAGATLRIFGLQSKDTEDTLATLAVATNKSALAFSFLNEAMSIVGPIANTFGISVKDTTALLGTLANAGFDASSAATATRNILLNLADSNGKLAKSLGGPVRTFPELLAGLEKLNAQGIDLATTLELTDKRSVAAFNTFLEGAGSAEELRASLDDVDGELKRIADERMNTVSGSTAKLKSAWEGFVLAMSGSKGVIKGVLDLLTKGLDKMTKFFFRGARVSSAAEADFETLKQIYEDQGEEAARELAEKMKQERESMVQHQIDRSTQIGANQTAKSLRKATEEVDAINAAIEKLDALIVNTKDEAATVVTDPLRATKPKVSTLGSGKWSLAADENYLIAKAELERRYRDGEIASAEEYNEALYNLEVVSLNARLALGIEKGADRAKIQQELFEKSREHTEEENRKSEQLARDRASLELELITDATEKALRAEDMRYEEEKKKHEDNAEWLELAERKHQNNIRAIKAEAQTRELNEMQSSHDLERAELTNSWDARIAATKEGSDEYTALSRQKAEELAALDLEYLSGLQTLLEDIISTGMSGGVELTDEQIEVMKRRLQDVLSQINGVKASLAEPESDKSGNGSLFGVSQEQWAQFFSNLQSGKLAVSDIKAGLNGLGNAAQEGFRIASLAINKMNAQEEKSLKAYQKANDDKKQSLQKRLDAGLMTQAQYDAETQRLEEEQDAYEEDLALRKAERDKKMNIAQAIINTALGVAKTLAEWGIPAGIAPAAIMGAMGATQVALIASTPVSGAEEGGLVMVSRKQDGKRFNAKLSPDRRGFVNSPTVLVGENGPEYVIPNTALENPSIAPFIGAIETARRSGSLKSLNLAAVYPRMVISGRASGGYTEEPATKRGRSRAYSSYEQDNEELLHLLRKMNDTFSRPIAANVSMLGQNGIIEKTREYERQRKRRNL